MDGFFKLKEFLIYKRLTMAMVLQKEIATPFFLVYSQSETTHHKGKQK